MIWEVSNCCYFVDRLRSAWLVFVTDSSGKIDIDRFKTFESAALSDCRCSDNSDTCICSFLCGCPGKVQYSFGIMFTDAVLDYHVEHGEDPVLK